ncbi:MAG: hypothetical protein U0228_37785 [Myxococcaceae bacterium]
MTLHPEVGAWLEVERHARKTRRLAHAAVMVGAVAPALLLRALAHLAFAGIEPHFAAAFEQMAFLTPWVGGVLGVRWWLRRWAGHAGRAHAANIAARHGVEPSVVFEALHAR